MPKSSPKLAPCYEKGLVSVIIPVYNRVQFIEQTISSVERQTYKNFEIIVVDDGSTDGSYEFLEQLAADRRIVLLSHNGRVNKGQSAAINLGMRQCKGEFVAILDSDDLFEPEKLAIQVTALQNHPEIGLVYGMGTAIDASGKPLYGILGHKHVEHNDPNLLLLDCYFLLPQNSLVRSDVYGLVGEFDEQLRAAQDHDMLIRIAEVTKLLFVPEKVFRYRRHSNSISSTGETRRWRSGFQILRKAQKRYPYKFSTLIKRRAVLHFRLAYALYKSENKLFAALFHYALAGLLDPIRSFRVITGKERIQ